MHLFQIKVSNDYQNDNTHIKIYIICFFFITQIERAKKKKKGSKTFELHVEGTADTDIRWTSFPSDQNFTLLFSTRLHYFLLDIILCRTKLNLVNMSNDIYIRKYVPIMYIYIYIYIYIYCSDTETPKKQINKPSNHRLFDTYP